MDKKKKIERPRLRKEDISTPVNFVHVQHVGFGGHKNHKSFSGSYSACTSPTIQNTPFFDPNHRLSDSSLSGQQQQHQQLPQGKENRFSHSYGNQAIRPNSKPPLPPLHGSMSNLSIMGQRDSLGSMNFIPMQNSKQNLKTSFSGSLLNLSFLPFGKSGGDKSKSKSKRMSLGPLVSPSTLFTVPCSPPPPELPSSPPPPLTSSRNFVRRRSSSFAGQMDFQFNPEKPPEANQSGSKLGNSTISAWIKKPKISRNPSQMSPPMSPTYDELPPPPPCDIDIRFSTCPNPSTTDLPESPSYFELLPPPPSPAVDRKNNNKRNSTSNLHKSMSPSPPTPVRKMSLSTSDNTNHMQPVINGAKSSTSGAKIPAWRSKVVRVNAPTLPPLSVPLLRSSDGTLPTPPSWPLEPRMSELDMIYGYQETNQQSKDLPSPPSQIIVDPQSPSLPSPPISADLEPLPIQSIGSKVKKVEQEHVDPLSRLFQSRTSYNHWPIVMTELFSTMKISDERSGNYNGASKIYSELVTKTLELWLELGGGSGTFDDVISAFERAQNTISKSQSDAQDASECSSKL